MFRADVVGHLQGKLYLMCSVCFILYVTGFTYD